MQCRAPLNSATNGDSQSRIPRALDAFTWIEIRLVLPDVVAAPRLQSIAAREFPLTRHADSDEGDTAASQRWPIDRDGRARSAPARARSASPLRAGGRCLRSEK